MIFKNSIQVLSANCQGLQNIYKHTDVLTYLKETNASIVCPQDIHRDEKRYFKSERYLGA